MTDSEAKRICASVGSPSWIWRAGESRKLINLVRSALSSDNVSVVYSVKACSEPRVVQSIAEHVDGLAGASRFELRLIDELRKPLQSTHVASPALDANWLSHQQTNIYCSANSLSQWVKLATQLRHDMPLGVRVNPHRSVVDDPRYDPCRKHSKLGIPIDTVEQAWRANDLAGISGIHFHTACCTTSWESLLDTVKLIEKRLAPMMRGLEWINVGGGYQWDEVTDFGPLQEAMDLLTNKYGLEVFLEPGDGIVNSAGSLHASVVDLFESDGKMVAILDTTVNHLPEVFEYQYEPDVAEHVDGAPHEYILAGCSCLAGDIFGEYAFEEPLDIGSRVVFENVGAYSLVKANMFNGINLPSIYILHEDGRLDLIREFTYEDYLARCGGEAHAVMPAGV